MVITKPTALSLVKALEKRHHKELTIERLGKLSLMEKLANIRSEVIRETAGKKGK